MLKIKDKSLPIKGISGKLYPNQMARVNLNRNIDGARLIWNHDVAISYQQPQDFAYQWVKTYQTYILPKLLNIHTQPDLIFQLFTNLNLRTYFTHYNYNQYHYLSHYVYHFAYEYNIKQVKQLNVMGLYQISLDKLKHVQLNTNSLRPLYQQIQTLADLKWLKSQYLKNVHNYRVTLIKPWLKHLNHDHLTYTEELSNRYFKRVRADKKTHQKVMQYIFPKKYSIRNDLNLFTTQLVHNSYYQWLKQCDSTALRSVNAKFDQTLNQFFKNPQQFGFPKFKSYRYAKQAYTTISILRKDKTTHEILNSSIEIVDQHHIKIPKLGLVRCNKLTQDFKNILPVDITITRDARNQYYFSLTCYYKLMKTLPKTNKQIGLDLNVVNNFVANTGMTIKTVDYNAIDKRNLKIWERRFSKRQLLAKQHVIHDQAEATRISNHNLTGHDYKTYNQYQNVKKAREQVYRIKHHQANVRKMRLQKLTTDLVRNYDVIAIEDLSTTKMLKNHYLAKDIANQGWRMFRTMLEYKCQKFNKQLVVVNPKNTTQTCFDCGYVKGEKLNDHKLTLNTREWTCPQCHTHHNIDVNAAKNILKLGLEQLKVQSK